jgi:hypothetical protein
MNLKFTERFFESFQNLYWQNTKLYKLYEFIFYDVPRVIKNIWKFRKALFNHYWYDHHGVLMFLEIGLEDMSKNIEEKGYEVDSSRLKKIEKMRRVVELIRNYNQDRYIEMAESELGELVLHPWEFIPVEGKPELYELKDKDTPEEKEHNRKIFERSREIGEQEWIELFEILKGQDYSKFPKDEDFDKHFDGSGLRGWWD